METHAVGVVLVPAAVEVGEILVQQGGRDDELLGGRVLGGPVEDAVVGVGAVGAGRSGDGVCRRGGARFQTHLGQVLVHVGRLLAKLDAGAVNHDREGAALAKHRVQRALHVPAAGVVRVLLVGLLPRFRPLRARQRGKQSA